MIPSEALRAVSDALFGCWCPTRLATALGVSERSVRRWGAGEWEVPAGILTDCVKLLNASSAKTKALAKAITP